MLTSLVVVICLVIMESGVGWMDGRMKDTSEGVVSEAGSLGCKANRCLPACLPSCLV